MILPFGVVSSILEGAGYAAAAAGANAATGGAATARDVGTSAASAARRAAVWPWLSPQPLC